MANKSDIGLIGLAVMGENLVLNMESKGFTVSVFNRTLARVDNFIAGRAAGKNIVGTHSLEELVSTLKSPRKVFLMVKAGDAVCVVEAMKLFNPIKASSSGRIKFLVEHGAAVTKGQAVASVE